MLSGRRPASKLSAKSLTLTHSHSQSLAAVSFTLLYASQISQKTNKPESDELRRSHKYHRKFRECQHSNN